MAQRKVESRGIRVDIPPLDPASVTGKKLAEYPFLSAPDAAITDSVKAVDGKGDPSNGFMVWKEKGTDRTRWLAIYSNNFRDDDNPPEIISQKSQETYVRLVDEGIWDYPELWLWHLKGSAWGIADWLAYADGFAVASGTIYPGFEWLAESLSKQKNLRVSHGMPEPFQMRRWDDESVIDFHITTEISPLPGWAAANRLTSFNVIKGENTMPLPAEKKAWLKELGLPDAMIGTLEANIAMAGKFANEQGIESKAKDDAAPAADEHDGKEPQKDGDVDQDVKHPNDPAKPAVDDGEEDGDDGAETEGDEDAEVPPPTPAVPATPPTTPAIPAEPVEAGKAKKKPAFLGDDHDEEDVPAKKPAKKKQATPAPVYATREEVADALTLIVAPMLDSINALTTTVASMTKEMSALKRTDAEKIAATKEVTPTRSLAEIISLNLIGKEATRVDGRTTIGKDGPVETAPAATTARQVTPVGFLNDLIQNTQEQPA